MDSTCRHACLCCCQQHRPRLNPHSSPDAYDKATCANGAYPQSSISQLGVWGSRIGQEHAVGLLRWRLAGSRSGGKSVSNVLAMLQLTHPVTQPLDLLFVGTQLNLQHTCHCLLVSQLVALLLQLLLKLSNAGRLQCSHVGLHSRHAGHSQWLEACCVRALPWAGIQLWGVQ